MAKNDVAAPNNVAPNGAALKKKKRPDPDEEFKFKPLVLTEEAARKALRIHKAGREEAATKAATREASKAG